MRKIYIRVVQFSKTKILPVIKSILLPVILIGLTLLYGLYKSSIEKVPFGDSFYSLLQTIISEIWKVISVPSVFIILTILLFLIWNRRKLPEFLRQLTRFIRSIKIGNTEVFLNEILVTGRSRIFNQERLVTQPEIIEAIVYRKIRRSLLHALCQIDGKAYDTNILIVEVVRKISEFNESHFDVEDVDPIIFWNIYYFLTYFSGILYDLAEEKPNGNYVLTIYPDVKEIITRRLDEKSDRFEEGLPLG